MTEPTTTIEPNAQIATAEVIASSPDSRRGTGLLGKNIGVAAGTALSRLTGVLRIVVLAAALRKGLPDAYNQANNTPNIVYELLLGGVLSATLVPLMTRLQHDHDDEGTTAVTSVGLVALVALTAVAVLGAPFIFHLYNFKLASGVDVATYRSVGTFLTRIFMVQILFYGLNAFATAMLNARNRFLAAAWAPSLSNVAIIASLLLVRHHGHTTLQAAKGDHFVLWVLGLGATGGIAIMALSLLPSLISSKAPLRFRPDFRNPAVRTLIKLSGWALGYALSNQVAVVVVQNLTKAGSGANIAYAIGFTIFMLPNALFAVSLSTTFLPDITRAIARHDKAGMIHRTGLGLRLTALLTIPAGFGLFALRGPLVGAIFGGGPIDTSLRERAIAGFALGLGGFSMYLFTLRVFYAHRDSKTPFIINVVENLINIALAFPLTARYGLLGLAGSFAIAYIVSTVLALWVLTIKVPGYPIGEIFASAWRMVLAAALTAEIAWVVSHAIGGLSTSHAVARLIAGMIAGTLTYFVALWALRSPELQELRSLAKR